MNKTPRNLATGDTEKDQILKLMEDALAKKEQAEASILVAQEAFEKVSDLLNEANLLIEDLIVIDNVTYKIKREHFNNRDWYFPVKLNIKKKYF